MNKPMAVNLQDYRSVNAWVRQALKEGWRFPRRIAERAELLDFNHPAAFCYCRICGRTAADYEVLHTVFVDGRPPTDLEAVFEGGREGFVNCEEIICIDCLPDDGSYP